MSSSRTESPDLGQRAACTELRSVGVSGWREALAYEGRSYITPFAMPILFRLITFVMMLKSLIDRV
jgi:hypothetical protein